MSMFFFSFVQPANAAATKIGTVKWSVNTLNVGGIDTDKKSVTVGLKIKISDSDGICSGYVRVSRPLKKDSHQYYDLTLLQGSSENATWGATVGSFWNKSQGTWIVSGIYLSDCEGRVTKSENMSKGHGGKSGLLAVTTGGLPYAKISTPKVLPYAWRDGADDELEEIPFRFIVTAKDSKGKALPNAYVRLTVCVTLDVDEDEIADDDLDRCSFINLGKTNAKGTLIREMYASTIVEKGAKPVWAEMRLDEDDYLDENYSDVWSAYITVLKTKSTTYTQYSKSINLYDYSEDE